MKLFSVPARQYAEQRVNSGPELVDYMRRKQSAETAESHYVTAESRVPGLCVGSVVKIDSSFYQSFRSLSRKTLGEFIITEIVHEVGEDGYYRNRFKALPSALEVIPVPDARIPHAETQMATVTRNDDPRGSGRIQVRMNWQADDMNTNWIRVMTPDAGRSGSSLMLNDSVGSVTLHDRGGVSMNFDGAGCSSFEARKNSTLNAGQNHTINAGSNSSVNAGANYSANVGKGASCLNMDANGDIVLEGKNKITIKVGENTITISADGIVTNAGSGDVKTTATTGSVTIESTSSEASFKGSTNTNIGGGECTYVTASDVEINQS